VERADLGQSRRWRQCQRSLNFCQRTPAQQR
jgi:hypothetical protein